MDPPEEDINALELASLIEETTNDSRISRPPLHPSRQQQFSKSSRNNNTTKSKRTSLPIATTPTPTTTLTVNNTKLFSYKQIILTLLTILIFIVLLLLAIDSKTESTLENDIVHGVGSKFDAVHDLEFVNDENKNLTTTTTTVLHDEAAATTVDEQQQQQPTTTTNDEDGHEYPLTSFCGSCMWQSMGFNCNARISYLVNTYHMEEEHAMKDTLEKGECVSPNYVPSPKKDVAQAAVGEVKEKVDEKVDETNDTAAAVTEVVPSSSTTTNDETIEEKTSTMKTPIAGHNIDNGNLIGYHEPSLENIYSANHYYKPKGVGYTIAPRGGLHPIYMTDIHSDYKKQLEQSSSEYYTADEYELSPYADYRLKLSDEERIKENIEWKVKLEEIRTKYGYWNFVDDYTTKNNGQQRPTVNWQSITKKKDDDSTSSSYNPLLGELDPTDFPKDTWQTDDVYVSNFLKEGKALVKRVIDAISEEYGWDDDTTPDTSIGGIHIPDATSDDTKYIGGKNGLAWMYESSFNALSKKILNAMITNDHFFVTLGGHSAAAGHGNNFRQSYMMEFQRVMEPIFDRLGMILVSSNRAQGGMGTLQSALAGVSIYGDADFMLWDSSMTEKDGKAQDVFWRQAILAGTRVPILFDMGGGKGTMDAIHREVGVHVGGVSGGAILPKFKNIDIDFAEKKYNAVCWTERVDVSPDVQYDKYGGQASWHPGNFVHQSTARKISLLFLHALDKALSMWEEAASEDGGNPLDGKYWHLEDEENAIRDAARNVNASATQCGMMFDFIPRRCTTSMRGAGEWAPRNDPDHSSIRSLIKAAPNGYVPGIIDVEEQLYTGRDPMIPSQRVPMGEVDVATIARSLPPRTSESSRRGGRRRRTSSLSFPSIQPQKNLTIHQLGRNLDEVKIIPGEGWASHGHPAGFCDGTCNSVCYREQGSKSNHCLMSGHNDARGAMKGDGLSGWLVFQLKDVTEGIFMARMEDYHPYRSNQRTEGWEKVNNGRDDGRRQRRLKAPPPPKPPEWQFEVAINGEIVSSWNYTEYANTCHYLSYNNGICLLWNDEQRALKKEKEDIELALRLQPEGGRIAIMGITHVYYA